MACYAYVFPCTWEDHCKIGFSHDPLARIAQLHPRWFEFFDLERGFLIEGETERDARDLELALRRPLAAHRAPQPLTIRSAAGGQTEWVRGAHGPLQQAARELQARGYRVHAPLSVWLRDALLVRSDLLYDWAAAQLTPDELEHRAGDTVAQRVVRDTLEAHVALGIAIEPLLPADVFRWYSSRFP